MSVTERDDPTTALRREVVPAADLGDFIEEQKKSCGLIVYSIDAVIHELTGWSVIEWLYDPFAGDWNALQHMKDSWPQVADSIRLVQANYEGLRADAASVWSGDGLDAAVAKLDAIIDYHANQAEGCDHLSTQLGHALEVSEAAIQVVSLALNFLDSLAQELIEDAAVPVLGWAKGAVTAPGKVRKAVALIQRGADAVERLTTLLQRIPEVARIVNIGLTVTDETLKFGNTVLSADAASHLGDTSRQAFG
ncbi:hypothetical protein P5P86_00155 [Nocardioides sp. BP30]|uniref:hypothetical protein n=1 Tax=Nocardioides sp. BP30 TaxID=3036374 RepID=UPI002469B26C|nr:hypothetical protein [Nocardioides sp. BP30]WGL52260.1 hypothetical protein P5P86_00155 [Nocardioides sp. BP30]